VLLKNNYNPLISKYFNTPVSKTRMKKHKKRVYMIIELKLPVIPLREKFILYKDDLYFFFIEFEPVTTFPRNPKKRTDTRESAQSHARTGCSPVSHEN